MERKGHGGVLMLFFTLVGAIIFSIWPPKTSTANKQSTQLSECARKIDSLDNINKVEYDLYKRKQAQHEQANRARDTNIFQ